MRFEPAIARTRRSRLNRSRSVPPAAALTVVRLLAEADLAAGSRIVMEKPFGTDLESAVALNDRLHRHLEARRQVYDSAEGTLTRMLDAVQTVPLGDPGPVAAER